MPPTLRALELAIPPAAVAAIAALAMWGISLVTPSIPASPAVRGVAAAILAGAGVCLSLSGVASFRRARTTINPMKPDAASTLVRSGVYRVTRNPMYLGFLVVLLAWAAFLANLPVLTVPPAFVLYMNRFQIGPEERALSARFGRAYAEYEGEVRRWL